MDFKQRKMFVSLYLDQNLTGCTLLDQHGHVVEAVPSEQMSLLDTIMLHWQSDRSITLGATGQVRLKVARPSPTRIYYLKHMDRYININID